MQLKPSRYNFVFDDEHGVHLAFNAMSGGFFSVAKDKYDHLLKMLNPPYSYEGEDEESKAIYKQLLEGRFLIEHDIDELEVLKVRNLISRFKTNSIGLTVMVTRQCNFACQYCYENKCSDRMERSLATNLVKFLQREIPTKKRLHINWFGGEPLLCFDLIKEVSESIINICRESKCYYSASLTTNGYLLTKDVSRELDQLNFNVVQVTLDGPPDIHDKRRPLLSGGGTFDQILKNLKEFDSRAACLIRINVDKSNADRGGEIFDHLSDLRTRGNVFITFGLVDPSSPACGTYVSNCLSEAEYANAIVKLSKIAQEKGFKLQQEPRARAHAFCHAVIFTNFTLDPTGKIFRCSVETVNDKDAVGYLDPEGRVKITNQARINPWLSWNPTEDPLCRDCEVLPLCMGGCRYRRAQQVIKNDSGCAAYKFNLKEILKLKFAESPAEPVSACEGCI